MQNRTATRAVSTLAHGPNPENGTEVWPPSALACGNPKEAESDPAGADFVMRAKPSEPDGYPCDAYLGMQVKPGERDGGPAAVDFGMRTKPNNPAILRRRRHFRRRPAPP